MTMITPSYLGDTIEYSSYASNALGALPYGRPAGGRTSDWIEFVKRVEGSYHASSRQRRPFRGKAKVQNHQLVHLQQSSHQPWLPHFLAG